MTTDLFLTKADALKEWCKQKGFFSKVDITRYGLDNYYISAWRRVDEWCAEEKPIVRRVPKDECIFRNLKGKVAWYEYIGNNS